MRAADCTRLLEVRVEIKRPLSLSDDYLIIVRIIIVLLVRREQILTFNKS